MESRVNYALVGIFVLILGTAMIAIALWLIAGGPRYSYTRYLVLMHESVSALSPNAPVRYNGVKVGYVAGIRLDKHDPQVVRILLDIVDGTPIKVDTRATLQMQGITGIAFIGLSGGAPPSPPLTKTPGEPYPVIPSTPSLLRRLSVILTQVGGSLTMVSKRLGVLLSEQNMKHFSSTMANLDALSGTLVANRSRIDATLRNLDTASAKLPGLLDELNRSSAQLPTLIDHLNQSSKRFNKAADALGSASNTVQRSMPQINRAMQKIGNTAATYGRLGQQLQRDPSALLYGPTPVKPGPGE